MIGGRRRRRAHFGGAAPSYVHGWSPDGAWLSFVANRDGKQYDLYRIRATGGDEQRLTSDPAHDDGSDYSPDGRWIYFNSGPGHDQRELLVS